MHPACTFCARAQLAAAKNKLLRARLDKPTYAWDAVGCLMEASNELVTAYPRMANTIVRHRIALEDALQYDPTASKASIPFDQLIQQVGECEATKRDCAEAAPVVPEKAAVVSEKPAIVSPIPAIVPPRPVIPKPAAALPTPAKTGCTPCQESAKLRDAGKRWEAERASGSMDRLVAIIAPLGDFNPSYSLVTVILDQVRAIALLPKTKVVLLVRSQANCELLPPLADNVEVLSCIPNIGGGEDQVDAKSVAAAKAWLKNITTLLGKAYVFTHDLVFQTWFSHWAKALHELGPTPGIQFYHWMHSSVGTRPTKLEAQWRCSVPPGHTMVALNTADLPYLCRYYQTTPENFISMPNPRDIRVFYGMPLRAADLVAKHDLHTADIVQVYPLSGTRMQAKGVTKVIDVFNALCRLDPDLTCRLLIVDAHANGTEGKNNRELMVKYATSVGLPDKVLSFASDSVDPVNHDMLSRGLDAVSIRCLLQIANVFIFPTTSEAGSLVLMEAAMAGNLLVLNESLPCMADYISSTDAIWVPFGSTKEAAGSWHPTTLAERIHAELSQNKLNTAKRSIMRDHNLEAYRDLLLERVFTPMQPAMSAAPAPEGIPLRSATLLTPEPVAASP